MLKASQAALDIQAHKQIPFAVLTPTVANQLSLLMPSDMPESEAFLKEQLITYIGNKRALLPFIGAALQDIRKKVGKKKLVSLDLFSGTGVVARYLKKYSEYIIANDIETYSAITNKCYLSNASAVPNDNLRKAHKHVMTQAALRSNASFITKLYAPHDENCIQYGERVFYTRRNALYLDSARYCIDFIEQNLQPYLLAPLLAQASVHANTSGVFKGFYKNKEGIGQFGGHGKNALARILRDIVLPIPIFSRFSCDYLVTQYHANEFVKQFSSLQFDVAYLDPPYNQHPYGSNYFMLNLIATNKEPQSISSISGIPSDWNRSPYNNKVEAQKALFDVIQNCNAKFILISYNSEGFIDKDSFVHFLQKLGRLTVLETQYNTFRGSRNLAARATHVTEFLYLLKRS